AYKDPKESWNDHKALLLNAERYQIFRDVMHDYISGAWAIRRAGYATDPQYPLKLIRLVNQYNLQELDRIIF
ncbi:MAG TPA: exonuclease, partial [Gudongella oleilytica]|nr:exonuclease [Gudongella oleilytica]